MQVDINSLETQGNLLAKPARSWSGEESVGTAPADLSR